MPLPPIPGTEWLRFRADDWRKKQQEQLDRLRETASAWDLEAQQAISGIGSSVGDAFSGLGTAVQERVQDVRETVQPAVTQVQDTLGSATQDWTREAQSAVDSIGSVLSQPDAQWNPLEGAPAAFPDDPNAGAKFVAQSVGRGINTAQAQSQRALDAAMGYGPAGPNLGAQALGALDVATTPFTAPGRATSAAATNLGASPETAAVLGGVAGAVGPGGTLSSIEQGLASGAPSALRFAPPALGALGAAAGVGTGIASGAPAEEVLTRGFEGANIGAGVGEMGATLGPQLPGIARGLGSAVGDYAGRFGEAAGRLYDAELGTLGAVRGQTMTNTAGRPTGRVMAKQLLAAGEEARPASRSQNGVSPDWGPPPPEGWHDPVTGERVVAPQAGEPISMSEYAYWDDVKRGVNPLPGLVPGGGTPRSSTDLSEGRYRWDLQNAPPPRGPNGELPGRLDFSPLPRVDWDGLLQERGYAPPQGTDPALIKQILTTYDDDDLKVKDVVAALGYTGRQAKAIEDDANAALNALGTPYKKTPSEWGAVKSEREAGGKFTYYSPKMGKLMFFDSSPEVVAAMRLDADPNVAEYLKGGGKRARVRFTIHPESRFDPNPPPGWEILRTQGILDAGKEGIYSPDFLVRSVPDENGNVREGMIEVKSLSAPNQPAYKIEEKVEAARDLFENHWGVPFHVWGEDQVGRRFMADLAAKNPADDTDELLARIGQGVADPAAALKMRQDFVKKMASGAATARTDPGPTWLRAPLKAGAPPLRTSTEEYLDFNAASKYPPVASDPSMRMPALRETVREQVARHNQQGVDGSTFTAAGDDVVTPDLGGYMVSVAPERMQRVVGHELKDWRLAQFVLENEDYLEAFPELHVGTFKTVEPSGTPITQLDLTLHVPDGQTATEVAALYRQKRLYDVAAGTNTPTDPKRWVPTNLTPEARRVRLTELLSRSAAADSRRPLSDATGGASAAIYPPPTGAGAANGAAGAANGYAGGRPGGVGVPAVGSSAGPGPDRFGAVAGAGAAQPYAPGGRAAPAAALAADGRAGPSVGGPGGAGGPAANGLSSPFQDFFASARAATQPLGARGATTGGERAVDIAAGTAGGVAGAATADEDATWQERLGRGALGASLGALGGANVRQLGRLGSAADTLGAVAGRAAIPSPSRETSGGGLGRAGRVASDLSQAMGSLPLLSVPGLASNFSSGAVRTIERVLGEAFEGRPIDALVDLGGVFKELPDAARRVPASVRRGPTADAPGAGAGPSTDPEDLFSRGGKLPFLATAGTRLNAATDQFWRDLNEAGALRVAERRGLSSANAAEHVSRAGDFATFGGPNTPVARGLTAARAKLSDPNATPAEKATGFAVQAFAPYVMMPERLLRASIETVFPGAHVPALIGAYRRGDQDAIRAVNGRMRLSGVTLATLWAAAAQGTITGPAPSEQKERLRREALGEQWETVELPGVGRVPLRYFGAFGQSASAIASIHDAVASGQATGDDFPKHLATAAGEAMKWTLDESYARDFGRFLRDVQQGRGPQSLAGTVGAAPGRLVAPLAGIASAVDPLERETRETPLGGVVGQVASRSGLRQLLPERIDPTTGEAQRRAGNPLTRYLGAARGAEETPENRELARHGLTPRTIGDGTYAGEQQTVDAVRRLRQAYGAETGKAVREVQKTPAYQKGTDAEKTKLLERALRDADFEAELRVGDTVKRSPKAQAAWEYSATAKYQGAPKGADANETRRYNRSVSQAKAARTEARKRDPQNPGRAEAAWARANPEEATLARKGAVSASTLRKKKAEIYGKHKVSP